MTTHRSRQRLVLRVLPWLVGAIAAQTALRGAGRLLAQRLDSGDEASPEIRRVISFGQVNLASVSAALARLQLYLVFAGAELDLTGARPQPGGRT
jgi:hypothetical protein